ncbi:MAG TPA: hypothetical protein PKL83_02625 [bacterium]|nr:hypothetical protein [bacterium]
MKNISLLFGIIGVSGAVIVGLLIARNTRNGSDSIDYEPGKKNIDDQTQIERSGTLDCSNYVEDPWIDEDDIEDALKKYFIEHGMYPITANTINLKKDANALSEALVPQYLYACPGSDTQIMTYTSDGRSYVFFWDIHGKEITVKGDEFGESSTSVFYDHVEMRHTW